MRGHHWLLAALTAAGVALTGHRGVAGFQGAPAWRAAESPLETRWTKLVTPANVHPEYPRPQMVRPEWLSLNGLWDFSLAPRNSPPPQQWSRQILVPFPFESALSGVMRPFTEIDTLWYHRTIEIPSKWSGQHVVLHFGAVDWRARVVVNGKPVGSHDGGYDSFSFDVTGALRPAGAQEIVVAVDDPTDTGTQPRGKQVRAPRSIWYTATSGIWQTVWLEPVPADAISSVRLNPDVDAGELEIIVTSSTAGTAEVRAEAFDGSRSVGRISGPIAKPLRLKIAQPKLWSPDSPHLYDLRLSLRSSGRETDRVTSYFGMRKIALGKDTQGRNRIFLNNQPQFQFGPLDQGFWPDGLYTAPTDDALRSDIEQMKKLGFNMARKHVKVEPERWYYWCDKLGFLVWQDMPSGDQSIKASEPDLSRTAASAAQYRAELTRLIETHRNHPSIVMWVPFNEGWGQFDTTGVVNLVRTLDSTRLVDSTSGWTDRAVGDVHDVHSYPGPAAPPLETARAAVLGEFGGLGLPLSGHTWQAEKNWGYRSFTTQDELTAAYLALIEKLEPLVRDGLAAAVYTQTTDVEIEVNGLLTYDRAVVKMDAAKIAEANRRLYALGR
jgi:beta-galactosidase/beta-glucuronidase